MRILFVTYPEKTFLQTMTPLAWALRAAGHEVRFASQPELAEDVLRAGHLSTTVGRDHGTWRLAELDTDEREAERANLPPPYDAAILDPARLDYSRMVAGYHHHVRMWHKLDNFPMIADLVSFARSWKPGLVVWEPTSYAGAIAAKACGAAHARMSWSIDVFGLTRERFLSLLRVQPAADREDPLGDWLAGYARKYDFEYDEDLVTGQFTLDGLPASMRMEADLDYLPVRYVPYGGPAAVPDWLVPAPRRPRVALTLGITAANRFSGYTVDVQDILDSLADLDIEVVATIAEREQSKLRRVPANTRVVHWVPLHALVQTCSAVIHHAGPGTLCTTTVSGVPQVALPWDFDEPELARRLAARGAGIVLAPDAVTGSAVRDALLKVMEVPAFADSASALQAEMLAMPSPNEVVGELLARAQAGGG